jgi:hypothetical protein
LLTAHLALLSAVQFTEWPWADALYDFGIMMGLIPLVACVRGRIWPYMQILPITLLPIAGKTLKAVMYPGDGSIEAGLRWPIFFLLPVAAAIALAVPAAWLMARNVEQRPFIRNALLLTTWMYFRLKPRLFRLSNGPWLPWSDRNSQRSHIYDLRLGIDCHGVCDPRH